MAAGERPIPSLSAKETLILQLLRRSREMYGLELVAASDGALKRGTVYVTLGRMERKGFVTSAAEAGPPPGGGLPRRLYSATPHGRQVLAALTQVRRRLAPRLA
jgi:DNA-binding PadR family transcriptional regulator